MAPTRKSRSVNKRFSNEISPDKSFANSSKTKQRKRKLSDKLGPQWTKGELARFYEAYRKYGKDWKKVASLVRNRSVDMVEALYNMNRAYLSLPDGTASVVGLIAMMTDHYNVLEGSDSERESDDAFGVPLKPQKRKRVKVQLSNSKEDNYNSQLVTSGDGCLSMLKRVQSYGTHLRATGKRTPRVPVSYLHKKGDRESSIAPTKLFRKSDVVANEDDARVAALALAEASQLGDSPKVSLKPYRKKEPNKTSSVGSWEKSNLHDASIHEDWVEGGRGSRKCENGTYVRDRGSLTDIEGVGTVEVLRKGKKFYGKNVKIEEIGTNNSDEEACSGTEGLKGSSPRGKLDIDILNVKTQQCSQVRKKRSKELFFGDESSALDALQTLADLSTLMLPVSTVESGFSLSIASFMFIWQEFLEEDKKSMTKGKHNGQISAKSEQWKPAKTSGADLTMSTTQVSAVNSVSLPAKRQRKRKMDLTRRLIKKEGSSSGNIVNNQPNTNSFPQEERVLLLKEKLSRCLSCPLARRWCTFEWFYSAIDYPWFAKREFVDYLTHVGLEHIPRLTRVEWGVIRSSLGKPRRFSERFLYEEREKLEQYRDSVRKHYAELRAGAREGLPTDLARPLSVGKRVIAIHPKTRELHDGKVLTVDHTKCSIMFDSSDLGVEFVMDIDCMPLNPLDYVPEALRRQNFDVDKCSLVSKEPQMNGYPNFSGSMRFPFTGQLEGVGAPVNTLVKQVDTSYAIPQAKVSETSPVSAQQTMHSQSCVTAHNQAREADIQALSLLNRALDEKVSSALLILQQHGSPPPTRPKPSVTSTFLGCLRSSLDDSLTSQDSGSEILKIVKGSRSKASAMVDAAIKAVSSMNEGEDAFLRISEALDDIDKGQLASYSRVPGNRSQEQVNDSLNQQNGSVSSASEPMSVGFKLRDSDNETRILSDLITSCVSTVLMIQMCTERQYPPTNVAQIIDSAVTSLQPYCPQNLPIYREIQMCMGRIKTQILALIPT
ncbi:protein ALWAYS EARLY 2 [Carica papaya]|uniref:protein ALWAYS EARLY 2 n=1 Tax=Carica papaya TaxID=3649 RepID=UPI000B8D19B8|nr:protein ALWAYS EARLY 2 [Carica papaya]